MTTVKEIKQLLIEIVERTDDEQIQSSCRSIGSIIDKQLKDQINGAIDELIDEGDIKICSECGHYMDSGFCIEWGEEYYCSDICLHKNITEAERLELYDDGNSDSYRTEREE